MKVKDKKEGEASEAIISSKKLFSLTLITAILASASANTTYGSPNYTTQRFIRNASKRRVSVQREI
jgi:hypothetical protein